MVSCYDDCSFCLDSGGARISSLLPEPPYEMKRLFSFDLTRMLLTCLARFFGWQRLCVGLT